MKKIHHTGTLVYYDGVQVFEGRDEAGGRYIGVLADSANGSDSYIVVEVAMERMQRFRSETPDLKRLLIEGSKDGWYLAETRNGFGDPLTLEEQSGAVVENELDGGGRLRAGRTVVYVRPAEPASNRCAQEMLMNRNMSGCHLVFRCSFGHWKRCPTTRIDTSDAPEVLDLSDAKRGVFCQADNPEQGGEVGILSGMDHSPWDSAEFLTDDETVIEYLKAALAESDPVIFLKAARNVASRQGTGFPMSCLPANLG